jgi:hypothetical protein
MLTVDRLFIRVWLGRIYLPSLNHCFPPMDSFRLEGFQKFCKEVLMLPKGDLVEEVTIPLLGRLLSTDDRIQDND